jgi:hypothetical protein
MPYTAKAEDVEALFTAAEFSMYVCVCWRALGKTKITTLLFGLV